MNMNILLYLVEGFGDLQDKQAPKGPLFQKKTSAKLGTVHVAQWLYYPHPPDPRPHFPGSERALFRVTSSLGVHSQ